MWRINFLLALKTKLKKASFWKNSKKDILVNFLEESFDIFEGSYLDQDVLSGLINPAEKSFLSLSLRNRVYYFANSIFNEVCIDINIEKTSYQNQLVKSFKYFVGFLYYLKKINAKYFKKD